MYQMKILMKAFDSSGDAVDYIKNNIIKTYENFKIYNEFYSKLPPKKTNNSVANLDYELAEQFMNADFKFVERDLDENGQYDGILIGKSSFI